jgi:rRNA maturation protein Rpf1
VIFVSPLFHYWGRKAQSEAKKSYSSHSENSQVNFPVTPAQAPKKHITRYVTEAPTIFNAHPDILKKKNGPREESGNRSPSVGPHLTMTRMALCFSA